MLRKYTFWLETAAVLQLLTAIFHCFSLIADPQPANPTEKQLTDLMEHYRMDAGAGFHPTTQNLFNALSAFFRCFAFLAAWSIFISSAKKLTLEY